MGKKNGITHRNSRRIIVNNLNCYEKMKGSNFCLKHMHNEFVLNAGLKVMVLIIDQD